MGQGSQDTFDWYDEDDAFEALNSECDAALVGLPESWRHYGWWVASIAFAVVWMLESWTSSGSLSGMAGGLLGLLLTLTLCYSVFQFCKPYSERLGHALCLLAAATMLIGYSFQ
jgi:hypothetical protein